MLQIICCDDEAAMRKTLIRIIEPELQLQGINYQINEFDSGEALLSSGLLESTDMLFLDIEMNELNGIETAKHVRKINQRAVIVFITAFADFVFQGYEVRALNYILKPYSPKKIIEIVHEALDQLAAVQHDYFLIEQKSGITRIALKDICYFTSERRKLTAVTADDSSSFYGKLNDLVLPDYFFRIHNRYFVNLNYVTQIEAAVLYCNQAPLPISRKYRQALMAAFAKKMLG